LSEDYFRNRRFVLSSGGEKYKTRIKIIAFPIEKLDINKVLLGAAIIIGVVVAVVEG